MRLQTHSRLDVQIRSWASKNPERSGNASTAIHMFPKTYQTRGNMNSSQEVLFALLLSISPLPSLLLRVHSAIAHERTAASYCISQCSPKSHLSYAMITHIGTKVWELGRVVGAIQVVLFPPFPIFLALRL